MWFIHAWAFTGVTASLLFLLLVLDESEDLRAKTGALSFIVNWGMTFVVLVFFFVLGPISLIACLFAISTLFIKGDI